MKVILLEDVRSLGKKDDIVEVKEGYARNFLFTKNLGVPADSKNLNDVKLRKAHEAKVAAEKLAEAKELAAKIEAAKLTCKVKSGKDGKVFGSVSSKEIAAEMKKQNGIELDKKKLVLPDALKNLGTYKVNVKLHPDVTAVLTVDVLPEE
ncbi:MAG TPA: 50S ribosomal protein L9 [Lachnospiraceae bacterium]|nr:50S ribosomal protein L9 [Lachnospiraceae bacterium]HAL31734.1 50S ribosomal protein L9 [Lachnospiraceae bacterium]HCS00024.1 50S ribosomal protein L9 [Lachnospiraceae bacterium]